MLCDASIITLCNPYHHCYQRRVIPNYYQVLQNHHQFQYGCAFISQLIPIELANVFWFDRMLNRQNAFSWFPVWGWIMARPLANKLYGSTMTDVYRAFKDAYLLGYLTEEITKKYWEETVLILCTLMLCDASNISLCNAYHHICPIMLTFLWRLMLPCS